LRAWVGVTDWNWYRFLASQRGIEEVNFWQPGGTRTFASLAAGELFLFKLTSPRNVIAGGGFFVHSTLLPLNLAWDTFGLGNGASSRDEMKRMIDFHRRRKGSSTANYTIGCILLAQPFFLAEANWIPAPPDWKPNIVQGKGYDLTQDPGLSIYAQIKSALRAPSSESSWPALLRDLPEDPRERYGQPVLVRPRLGQGLFRALVTDAYDRRCAVTSEKVLPVLEAAHIRPYRLDGPHQVNNGILLRSDLHRLFDDGYLTVSQELRLQVSRRIHDEFDNGRAYYAFDGQEVRAPKSPEHAPSLSYLAWHNEQIYRG
jgi:putative restriction endonuclease